MVGQPFEILGPPEVIAGAAAMAARLTAAVP
jgi:hypothetical protein